MRVGEIERERVMHGDPENKFRNVTAGYIITFVSTFMSRKDHNFFSVTLMKIFVIGLL